jgi:hypothetical protein
VSGQQLGHIVRIRDDYPFLPDKRAAPSGVTANDGGPGRDDPDSGLADTDV